MSDIGEEKKVEVLKQGEKAFEALQNYAKLNDKKFLFTESKSNVSLVITYKKIALHYPTKRAFVHLPYPIRDKATTSLCLILPDIDRSEKAQRDPDVDAQAREWSEILRKKHGLAGSDISKIFTYTQLTREYSQPADRAKLVNTYDIFLVEAGLFKKAITFLGVKFRTAAKKPLPIHVNGANFPEQLQRAYNIVNLPFEALKDSIEICFSKLEQTVDQFCANLAAIITDLFDECPGGEHNIRSLYLKVDSVKHPLPIFFDFGSASDVKIRTRSSRKNKEAFEFTNDCSTLPEGLSVRVRRDGLVTVVNPETQQEIAYPTWEDEWEKNDDIKPHRKRKRPSEPVVIRKIRRGKKKIVPKKMVKKPVLQNKRKKSVKKENKIVKV